MTSVKAGFNEPSFEDTKMAFQLRRPNPAWLSKGCLIVMALSSGCSGAISPSPGATPLGDRTTPQVTPSQTNTLATVTEPILSTSTSTPIEEHRDVTLDVVSEWNMPGYADAAWLPDSTAFVVADGNAIYDFDIPTLQQEVLLGDDLLLTNVGVSPDGNAIASASSGVRIWDVNTGSLIEEIVGSEDCPGGERTAFHPNGRLLATGIAQSAGQIPESAIFFWDIATGMCIGEFARHERHLFDLAFNADGSLLVTTTDGFVFVWDTESRRELCKFPALYVAAFAPIGTVLAVPSPDGVALMDTSTCQPGLVLPSSPTITSIAYHPSGELLAVASIESSAQPNHVTIWNVTTGDLVYDTNQIEHEAVALAFSPDGHFLLSVSRRAATREPATITLWSLQP